MGSRGKFWSRGSESKSIFLKGKSWEVDLWNLKSHDLSCNIEGTANKMTNRFLVYVKDSSLILNWRTITFNIDRTWSSGGHSFIDSQLNKLVVLM